MSKSWKRVLIVCMLVFFLLPVCIAIKRNQRGETHQQELIKTGWLKKESFTLNRNDINPINVNAYAKLLDKIVKQTSFQEPGVLKYGLAVCRDSSPSTIVVLCYSNDIPAFERIVKTFDSTAAQ